MQSRCSTGYKCSPIGWLLLALRPIHDVLASVLLLLAFGPHKSSWILAKRIIFVSVPLSVQKEIDHGSAQNLHPLTIQISRSAAPLSRQEQC